MTDNAPDIDWNNAKVSNLGTKVGKPTKNMSKECQQDVGRERGYNDGGQNLTLPGKRRCKLRVGRKTRFSASIFDLILPFPPPPYTSILFWLGNSKDRGHGILAVCDTP
jgi:hypothetical protein